MHRKMLAAAMAVVLMFTAVMLGSCNGKSDYPVTIGSIMLNSEPENIVILNKNLADIISCMGYDVKMVGRSDEVNQKGMNVVPSVGIAADASPASIDELGADIIFADESLNTAVIEQLNKKNIPVVILEKARTPKQIKNLYKKLGTLLGGNVTGKAKGTDACKTLFSELKDVKNAVNEKSIVKTVCYLYIDNGVLKTVNNATWGANMLDYTGATNVFKNSDTDVVDPEKLTLSNPDYIFCKDEDVINYLNSSDKFQNLSALSEKTFIIPYDEITMQGDTALDVLEKMLKNMYPEDFS
ncbi:MAG: ABC transporter substrate-binding protein [Ruminococcus sp.]|nr:ABC transporter substrate-binding protein [Ruminococcus sp.]